MHCINEVFKVSLICIFVISSVRCDSVIKAIEGDEAQLHFPYPCDCPITLQYANRRPFYFSVDPEHLLLNADQSERFTLQKEKNIAEGNCSLQLNINPVKRTDSGTPSGTYILLGCNNDYIERVAFYVRLPPGPAHCHLGGIHNTGSWVWLRCRATVGSMGGQIQCYQGGTRIHPLMIPSKTSNMLEQTILVQQNQERVFCCSFLWTKERCDCNDFEWDPISKNGSSNASDPCPSTTMIMTKATHTFPLTVSSPHNNTLLGVKATVPSKGEMIDGPNKQKILIMVVMMVFILSYN